MPDFFARHNLQLPQLDGDQKAMPEEVFSQQGAAIQETNEVSVPGLSGKIIAFFKLLSVGCLLS
jgi:hypothetical protein